MKANIRISLTAHGKGSNLITGWLNQEQKAQQCELEGESPARFYLLSACHHSRDGWKSRYRKIFTIFFLYSGLHTLVKTVFISGGAHNGNNP
jgi:hypothetical protein